ncbi:MAG: ribose 5-phosphate isomerase B [Pseudomonadota bacterium]
MRIAVGSDHAGYHLKEAVKAYLTQNGHQVQDMGTNGLDSTDYPVYAAAVAQAVTQGRAQSGVLVCGSGLGMCMTANRFHGARAALAPTSEHARLGRQHNDANILCLGERLTPQDQALEILRVFLETDFEGGRHQRRVDEIESLSGGRE